MRFPVPWAVLACLALAVLPHGAAGQSIQERIEQGLSAAGEPASGMAENRPPSITVAPNPTESADVSLAPSSQTSRLRTTLDPIQVEQRIDKGLTAAGEASAFPPDLAFGAFQRGWFLTAFSLALERAENGDPVAQTLLGVLQSRGLGVKQDLSAAAEWFRLAGQGGDKEALYSLGQLHLDGRGVERDIAEAARLFRLAADKDHSGAARELGYLLLGGSGVDQNAMLGAAFLSRAARLGDMDSQFTLGSLYIEGVGVANDEAQAARWFAEAAQNGHVGAQVEYAILLYNGRGITKNKAEAAYWLRRAAEADNPAAQLRLARLLADDGRPEDELETARWYLIAKARGVDDADMEVWLLQRTPETRDEAAKAAADWIAARRGVALAAAGPAGARANGGQAQ